MNLEVSQNHVDDIFQFVEHETWEHNTDYASTPGYCGSPYTALSIPKPFSI